VHGQDAQVDFRSDQPEARKLLQDAMPQLSAMLKGEGLLLSGGFVGSQTQQHPGAQERRSSAQNMRSAIIGVEPRTTEPAPALSRSPGRAVDLFV
jgi:flagellar hook-length control protein FliK